MSYELDKLKTVYCLNAVTIRIPRRWNIYPDANKRGFWCFHDDNEETGTLWIGVDRFEFPEPPDPSPLEVFDSWARDMVEKFDGKRHGDYFENLEKIGDRYLWQRRHDGVENGEELRFFWYQWMQAYPRGFGLTTFNFLVLKSQLDDPEIQALIETMDQEIRAADAHPFDTTGEDGGLAMTGYDFGPITRMNFDSQVKIDLPEKLLSDQHDNEIWEFEATYGDLEVILRITTDEVTLSDDDGNPIEINDENCEQILHSVTGGKTETRWITLVPNGSIVLDQLDEEAEDENSADWQGGSRQRLLWRHTHHGNGSARRLEVELECARDHGNSPRFLALAQLVDKGVREARFPGINSEAPETRRHAFGRFIDMDVPFGLRIADNPEREDSWYGWFDIGGPKVRIMASMTDIPMRYEDRDPIDPDDEHIFGTMHQAMDQFVAARGGVEAFTKFDRGLMSIQEYDEPDVHDDLPPDHPEAWRCGPLRVAEWHRVECVNGTLRHVAFLMNRPLDEADSPELKALVEQFDKAIREATFPGLEED